MQRSNRCDLRLSQWVTDQLYNKPLHCITSGVGARKLIVTSSQTRRPGLRTLETTEASRRLLGHSPLPTGVRMAASGPARPRGNCG